MNGENACDPVCPRLASWVHAWKNVNANALQDLRTRMTAVLSLMDDAELGINGRRLREADPSDWLFKFACIQFMKCGVRRDPRHFDGGAALLLGCLTLWGNRALTVESEPPVDLHLHPGSVYLASLAAAAHQVQHQDMADDEELLEVNNGADACRVVVLLRGSTFRAARGSIVPGPASTFQAAQRVVSEWQVTTPLLLPSMAECARTYALRTRDST